MLINDDFSLYTYYTDEDTHFNKSNAVSNGNNPRAIKLVCNGKIYETVKEFCKEYDLCNSTV